MRTTTPSLLKFLDRLRSRLPEVFLEGFEGLGGRGDRLLNAVAGVFGRVRDNIKAELDARLIMRATGGHRATGVVYVSFADTSVYEWTILAGTVLFSTPAGTRFRLVNDFTRLAADPAGVVYVDVEAEYVGTHANMPASAVSQWAVSGNDPLSLAWSGGTSANGKAEFLAGIASGDITIDTTDATEMSGGLPRSLDLRAAGRGLPREESESDRDLRVRIRTIPDAVTPPGIERAVAAALGVDLALVRVSEYWEHGFAWGVSGWGVGAWSQRLLFYVIVPVGSPVGSIQSLVDRIKPVGTIAIVIEGTP